MTTSVVAVRQPYGNQDTVSSWRLKLTFCVNSISRARSVARIGQNRLRISRGTRLRLSPLISFYSIVDPSRERRRCTAHGTRFFLSIRIDRLMRFSKTPSRIVPDHLTQLKPATVSRKRLV